MTKTYQSEALESAIAIFLARGGKVSKPVRTELKQPDHIALAAHDMALDYEYSPFGGF